MYKTKYKARVLCLASKKQHQAVWSNWNIELTGPETDDENNRSLLVTVPGFGRWQSWGKMLAHTNDDDDDNKSK